MARKILTGVLIAISALFFLLSLFALGAVWFYKQPLNQEAAARLALVDSELELAQSALQEASLEIDRTLRIVDSAEKTLSQLKKELAQARDLFGEVDKTVEGQLVPGLQDTRQQINDAIATVQEIRVFLQQLNDIPLVKMFIPNLPGDDLLADIISIGLSLDSQIAGMEALTEKASRFLNDASYLMGGDLDETRQNLQNFQAVINDYVEKLIGWRAQLSDLAESLPGWIDTASVVLTVFLLWFAFSQLGLLLHGLDLWRGGNPLRVLRKQ